MLWSDPVCRHWCNQLDNSAVACFILIGCSHGKLDCLKIIRADAPTIRMDCHPIQNNWCPHLCHPTIFYARCPSYHNPPNLSWLGTGTKYAGLHTRWLMHCISYFLLSRKTVVCVLFSSSFCLPWFIVSSSWHSLKCTLWGSWALSLA